VIVLEAEPGHARREVVARWIGEADRAGAATWLLECDVVARGIWSGLNEWLEDLLPRVRQEAPDLVGKHASELTSILPRLHGGSGSQPRTLTDIATGSESVRNYALDRAYRIGQGVVDLVDAWHKRAGEGEWVVACENFDRSGALVRRFFRELVRRRGRELRLTLLVCVAPGAAEETGGNFDPAVAVTGVRMDLPAGVVEVVSEAEMTQRALDIEDIIRGDTLLTEEYLPELIRCWTLSEQPERAARWQALALGTYNHYGFYEDALTYADAVLANLDQLSGEGGYFTRWNLVGSLFGTHVAVGRADRVSQVILEEAWPKITAPRDRARLCYVLAMLHARFLPRRDLAAAEEYLQQGLQELARAGLPDSEEHFLTVFMLNGLALVRHRQGNSEEAASITLAGFERLDSNLSPDSHRLHRSVLLYNLAQVYSSTGDYEQAIEGYSGAMAMDPNYSEYYNERGNAYLKLGRFQDAIRDYHQAIRLSPPYDEVWTNLGQCFRQMGRWEEAVQAYSRALDLDPSQRLPRIGRAQVYTAMGRTEEALSDYDAVLLADPDQALVLANRATVLYGMGRVEESIRSLDWAITLSPDTPDLYRNRAVALSDLGRHADAAEDLEAYLRLEPGGPARNEVEARLSALRPAVPAA
jgi:tetratricopeptide (TPR) repeat protein